MQKQSNLYIFGFAILVTVTASVILSSAATALKPLQALNARLDVIENILSVSGYEQDKIDEMKPEQVVELYREKFQISLLNKDYEEVDRSELEEKLKLVGYTDESLKEMETFEIMEIFNSKLRLIARRSDQTVKEFDPGYKLMYQYKPEDGVEAYIIPVNGKGLWGMIYGYLALEPDLVTVKGIRFYNHQETPGLGGEIEKEWFTSRFKGKQIVSDGGEFTSVTIVKGDASNLYEGEELTHYVDGISGATITGNGVNDFIRADLLKYEPYFKKLRSAPDGESKETGKEQTSASKEGTL